MLYPAATILLDLTANEEKIEVVCDHCSRLDLYTYIIQDKLSQLLEHGDDLKTTQLKKLRDLFIGMTLNLACNIENSTVIIELIKSHGVIAVLLDILQDPRQDWPTHGASQALMQYSSLSMQDSEIYCCFQKYEVK